MAESEPELGVTEPSQLFKCESVDSGIYTKNFLKNAVCELRFPVLLEFSDPKPPIAFANAIRKSFPVNEYVNEISFNAQAGLSNQMGYHLFRSQKENLAVSLKDSSISLETSKYMGFIAFKERLNFVANAAVKVIDSDFFTRVGLRYTNEIDVGEDPREGWVSDKLISTISGDVFSDISEYAGKLHFGNSLGGVILQHGIKLSKSSKKSNMPAYVIDIDVYRNSVEVNSLGEILDGMHQQAFDLFNWCLGAKSREFLKGVSK